MLVTLIEPGDTHYFLSRYANEGSVWYLRLLVSNRLKFVIGNDFPQI